MMRRNTFSAGSRGSVLILVVALLALLAVLATVYLTVSRTEVQSARMTSSGMNLDLARDAVMNQIQTLLYAASTDSQGVVGGLTAKPASNGKTSRYYDYPESGATPGQTDVNGNCPDEPWLVSSAYPASPTDISRLAAMGISPDSNLATIPNSVATLNAVGDPDHPAADASANLLSFSSPNGERYRYGVRIVDLSGMANLNTGATQQLPDPKGQYLSSYYLGNYSALHDARKGDSTLAFNLDEWNLELLHIEQPYTPTMTFFDSSDELELRSYGNHGTPYICRPAYVMPQLRGGNASRSDYTACSFSRDLRLRPDPTLPPPSTQPATRPSTQPADPPSPPYTLTPSDANSFPVDCGKYIWPFVPEKVWINPTLDVSTAATGMVGLFYHARAATNIATVMELAGYSTDESRAFAVNYLSYRWNGLVADPHIAKAYYYPAGPSFVDDSGICVRISDANGNVATRDFAGSSDLRAVLPGEGASTHQSKIYLAFLPQPFINEVAAQMQIDPATNALIITDIAVELYNPFPIPLSLNGFKLKFVGQETSLSTLFIPAQSFLTITQKAAGPLSTKISSGTQIFASPTLALNPLAGKITLTRPYIPRGKSAADPSSDAPIDEYAYDNLVAPAGITAAPKIYFLRRSNDAVQPAWQSAIQSSNATSRFIDGVTGTLTLGVANPNDHVTPLSLADRYTQDLADHPTAAQIPQAAPFRNFNDFNKILRICHQFPDPQSQTPSTFPTSLVSAQLGSITSISTAIPSPTLSTDFPAESQIHFDFKATPAFYLKPSAALPAGSLNPGDPRAVRLFDYLALLDRVPDRTIDIGSGPTSIDKLRIPGRININTASRTVLLGLPNLSSAQADAIIAYRNRAAPFSDASQFPGKGIRTLPELMIPLATSTPAATPPATLHDRDQAWASIINLCTTRSDTFVLYGYLEAIRPNPNTTHNNGTDWYNISSTTNDPHDPAAKNIRTGRIRWIAILDRSFCNYARGSPQFTLPKIVAIQNLPN